MKPFKVFRLKQRIAPPGGGSLYDRIMSLTPFAYCRNGEASGTVMENETGPDGAYSPGVQLGNPPLYPGGLTTVGGNFSNTVVGAINGPSALPAMTLLTVARPTDLTGTHMLGFTKDDGNTNRKFQWRSNGAAMEFVKIAGGVQTVAAPSALEVNTTYMLGHEVDASGVYSMYRNGLPVKMGSIAAADYGGSGQMHLGYSYGALANFAGTTGENAVFDKVLGPAAHAAMFAALSGLNTYFRRWVTQGMAATESYGTFDGTSYNRIVDGKLRLNSAARLTAARVRLVDALEIAADFEAVFSVTIPTDDAFGVPNAGLVYRTNYWGGDNDTFGYVMSIRSAGVQFGHGSNSSTPGYVDILQVARAMNPGTTHAVRIRVEGNRHRVWIDDDAGPVLDTTDSWKLTAGGFGLNSYVGSSGQTFIDVGDINIRPLATPHRYWRIVCTGAPPAGDFCISTFEMAESAGGANVCTGGTASASNYFGPFPPAQAFDGDPNTSWVSANSDPWLQYDFGAGNEKNIREYRLGSLPGPTELPKDWLFQHSDNGVDWATDDTRTGVVWGDGSTKSFAVA